MKRNTQKGVALVVTLIMLSLVTFLAIAFLGVAQRERASVGFTATQTDAKTAADAALARAETEILARMLKDNNKYVVDMFVSTNYLNPTGFITSPIAIYTNVGNVSYEYPNGTPLVGNDLLQNLNNLQYDARAPVFITLPGSPVAKQDFRFHLDGNRNFTNERNGLLPVVLWDGSWVDATTLAAVPAGTGVNVLSNFFVGDPEWIGFLEHSDLPHGPDNKFVARYAYMVLPASRSLDLNFIHNQAKGGPPGQDNFIRNHGFGTWEINLAGFLVDLNTNIWWNNNPANNPYYVYSTPTNALSRGWAFDDAMQLTRHRLNGSYTNLASVSSLYGATGYNAFANEVIDAYGNGGLLVAGYNSGLLLSNRWMQAPRNDDPDSPWFGGPNTNSNPIRFYDIQELFATNMSLASPGFRYYGDPAFENFVNNFKTNMTPVPGVYNRSSYDRYMFNRLAAQLGVDSDVPDQNAKINLNWDNVPPNKPTNFIPWTAHKFFTNTAERLFRTYFPTNEFTNSAYPPTGLSITNIPLYPVSLYTPEVHRLLQLSANIYDATTIHRTNVTGGGYTTNYPNHPSVFRPVFTRDTATNNGGYTNIYISGFVEVTNANTIADTFFSSNAWFDLPLLALTNNPATGVSNFPNINVYGVPVIIGAKKGYPAFNEFAMQTVVTATRKVGVGKYNRANLTPDYTNQMFIVGISNLFGFELWNSYTQSYPRALQIRATNIFTMIITNRATGAILHSTNKVVSFTNNLVPPNQWGPEPGRSPFITGMSNFVFLPSQVYFDFGGVSGFTNLTPNYPTNGPNPFPVPELGVAITNSFHYLLVDLNLTNWVVDCVNLTNLVARFDLSEMLSGGSNTLATGFNRTNSITPADLWRTNRVGGNPNGPTRGLTNQIWVSLNTNSGYAGLWRSYSLTPLGQVPIYEIDRFRAFMGLKPLIFPTNRLPAATATMQVPFTPTRKYVQNFSWQVNDPFVHYTTADLTDPSRVTDIRAVVPANTNFIPTQYGLNLGSFNTRMEPWGGRQWGGTLFGDPANFTNAFNLAVKDPGVRGSDDWNVYEATTASLNVPVAFPTNKFGNIGWLGRVHRGTPWQTVYMKSAVVSTNEWFRYAGSYGTHPTNDWRLFDLFTVGLNDQTSRGTLSVNQTNLAAWSAVLSGVLVITNVADLPTRFTVPTFQDTDISPNSAQLYTIVNALNAWRATNMVGGSFTNMGDLLRVPEFTVKSPFLHQFNGQDATRPDGIAIDDYAKYTLDDAAYERIPQQIMSLLSVENNPRFVIYAYGQSLKPAERSVVVAPGPYRGMVTNYQITGEVITRTVIRVENMPATVGTPLRAPPRIVVESFNVLPVQDY